MWASPEGEKMKKKTIMCVLLAATILLTPLSVAAQGEVVVIPYSDGWQIDGQVDEIEQEAAAVIATPGMPLRAWAMHDGETLYLAFEVLSPGEAWETFTVFDNGDSELYSTGDFMALCDESGCQMCAYEALYEYSCTEDLENAITGQVIELEAPVTLVEASHIVVGVILDAVEYTSHPIDVELEPVPPTQPEELLVEDTPISPPIEQPVVIATAVVTEMIPVEMTPEVAPSVRPISPFAIVGITLLGAVLIFAIWDFIKKFLEKRKKGGVEEKVVKGAKRIARRAAEKARKAAEAARKKQKKQQKNNKKARDAGRRAQAKIQPAEDAKKKAKDAAKKQKNVGKAAKNAEKKAIKCWGAARKAEKAAAKADKKTQPGVRDAAKQTRKAGDDAWEAAQKARKSIGGKAKPKPAISKPLQIPGK